MDRAGKNKSNLDATQRQHVAQPSQLDSLLKYRDECMDGLANAHETQLTPVHIREYQLLIKHINSVVEKITHTKKTDQKNLETAQENSTKHICFKKTNELLKNGSKTLQ